MVSGVFNQIVSPEDLSGLGRRSDGCKLELFKGTSCRNAWMDIFIGVKSVSFFPSSSGDLKEILVRDLHLFSEFNMCKSET